MNGQPDSAPFRIRSFVRRTGRITASQQEALTTLWPEYGVVLDDGPLDLAAVFGRDAPTVLEIGFGNGDSLSLQAAASPETNFLGVEVHEPGIGHCLIRIRELGLDNLKIVRGDAIELLERQVAASSLSRINLYFPDPWPKKRHHKRRIVQAPFLDLCARALATGGTLHVATDWANYAEHIDEVMQDCAHFACREHVEHGGEMPLARPQTKFEQRGLRQGHRIHDWIFVVVQ